MLSIGADGGAEFARRSPSMLEFLNISPRIGRAGSICMQSWQSCSLAEPQ